MFCHPNFRFQNDQVTFPFLQHFWSSSQPCEWWTDWEINNQTQVSQKYTYRGFFCLAKVAWFWLLGDQFWNLQPNGFFSCLGGIMVLLPAALPRPPRWAYQASPVGHNVARLQHLPKLLLVSLLDIMSVHSNGRSQKNCFFRNIS